MPRKTELQGHMDVCVCVYKVALGAVAPAALGCWLVSWQSSGSHGNAEQDAPSLDLWCSLPPGELHEDRGQKSMIQHSCKMNEHERFKGAERKVEARKLWRDPLLPFSHLSATSSLKNIISVHALMYLHAVIMPNQKSRPFLSDGSKFCTSAPGFELAPSTTETPAAVFRRWSCCRT